MDTPVTGAPRALLRLEGLAVFVAAVIAYRAIGASWSWFAVLLLFPDVTLVGYLAGPRVGAFAYNALHTYLGPALLAALAYSGVAPRAWWICSIWIAHIGLDRAIGYGLKFPTAFQATHLGTIGRPARTADVHVTA